MKKVAILCLVALELAVGGCAIPPPTTQVNTTTNGSWEAQLSLTEGTGQSTLLDFVTTFEVTNHGPLDVTAFSFLNNGTCFVTGETASGTAQFTTLANGQVNGQLKYTVQSGLPVGNKLALTGNLTGTSNGSPGTIGTLTNGAVTGTWTLTGSSNCKGSGTFTMCQGSATCTPIL
jgi:hypothetical protein